MNILKKLFNVLLSHIVRPRLSPEEEKEMHVRIALNEVLKGLRFSYLDYIITFCKMKTYIGELEALGVVVDPTKLDRQQNLIIKTKQDIHIIEDMCCLKGLKGWRNDPPYPNPTGRRVSGSQ